MTNTRIGTLVVRSITRHLFPPYTSTFLNHYYMPGVELYLYNYRLLDFILEIENTITDTTGQKRLLFGSVWSEFGF